MAKKFQSYKWLLTINNPADSGFTHDYIKDCLSQIKNITYWCMCDEEGGKEHTHHTHIYIYKKSAALTFDTIKNKFPTAHLDKARGTHKENRDYIRKEGSHSEDDCINYIETFEESGECPTEEPGKRTDLDNLYEMIKDGKSDYEIIEDNPDYIKRLSLCDRVRETLRYEEFRKKIRDVHVEYWYGKSGIGKTSGVFKKHGFENVYRVTDNKHPWDNYKGQDVVIFEEFSSNHFDISQMLIWLDIYPLDLPCRYNNKTACFTKVYMLSNIPFDYQFHGFKLSEEEVYNAWCRRIHVVKKFHEDGSIKEYHPGRHSKDDFIEISPEEEKYLQETLGF